MSAFNPFGDVAPGIAILEKIQDVFNDFNITSLQINNPKGVVKVDGETMTIDEFRRNYKNSEGLDYFEAVDAATGCQDSIYESAYNKISVKRSKKGSVTASGTTKPSK